MGEGGALAALFNWLRTISPYLYDGLLVLLGKEWQRKIEEARQQRRATEAAQRQLQEVIDANHAAHIVDSIARHPDELERLRNHFRPK
jgi:hypothetical protein